MESDASFFSVPSKIYAYLTVGKPILASMPPENLAAKKIKKMKIGYVSKPENINDFLHHSKLLIQNKKLRKQLSNNSKEYLKMRQTSIKQMSEIMEIWSSLMKDLSSVPSGDLICHHYLRISFRLWRNFKKCPIESLSSNSVPTAISFLINLNYHFPLVVLPDIRIV